MSSDAKLSGMVSDYEKHSKKHLYCRVFRRLEARHASIKPFSEYSDCVRTHVLHAQLSEDHSFSPVFDVK
jgi:hypothetical protein